MILVGIAWLYVVLLVALVQATGAGGSLVGLRGCRQPACRQAHAAAGLPPARPGYIQAVTPL